MSLSSTKRTGAKNKFAELEGMLLASAPREVAAHFPAIFGNSAGIVGSRLHRKESGNCSRQAVERIGKGPSCLAQRGANREGAFDRPGSLFFSFLGARQQTFAGDYCSLAYSALACFRMGMSESASFQSAKKS